MSDFVFDAQVRTDIGTGASRRLRRQGQLPAILYGADEAPLALSLAHNKVIQAQESDSFYSQVLTLNIDGKSVKAIIKDLQRHPFKPKLLHADFQRVSKGEALTTIVPLHMENENVSPGLQAGGNLVHQVNEVNIRCLPENLPEFVNVDLSGLEIGQAVHLSDLKLPKGVEIPGMVAGSDNDLSVVSIQPPKGGGDDAPTETEESSE